MKYAPTLAPQTLSYILVKPCMDTWSIWVWKQSQMWLVDCQGQEMVRIGNILGARFCLLAGLALVIGAHFADSWLKALTFAP